jgi:hypothetical protein
MNEELRLAVMALGSIGADQTLIEVSHPKSRVRAFNCDPYILMKSMGVLKGHSQNLIFLDMPRASKRSKAFLVGYDKAGFVKWGDVSHSDLDYRMRLKANCLTSAKLAIDCLAPDGLLLAIATPETYMAVRCR